MSVSTLRVVGVIVTVAGVAAMAVACFTADADSYWMLVVPGGGVAAVLGTLISCVADARDEGLDR